MHIPVIFEDNDVIIINKPSGVVVHPFDFSDEYTLVDFLHEHYASIFSIDNTVTLQDGRTVALGGIVHKLDRDTSGVMVVAKTQVAYDELKQQFRNHTITKTYRALVEGVVEKESRTIDAPLGRNKKDYKQMVNPANPRGELREAITELSILKHLADRTLVQLVPKTGRTHQLRAHMAYIGHPIVGDVAYGSTIDASRIMLHAETLSFLLHGKECVFTVMPEEEFNVCPQ